MSTLFRYRYAWCDRCKTIWADGKDGGLCPACSGELVMKTEMRCEDESKPWETGRAFWNNWPREPEPETKGGVPSIWEVFETRRAAVASLRKPDKVRVVEELADD